VVELKVRKFGNSLGVVLPKKVIHRLNTSDGEALFLIEAADGTYRLTPYDPAFEKKMTKGRGHHRALSQRVAHFARVNPDPN
jgi:antitoxin component of MazEF toxin-antitoxin module